jgi:hypothetical protein
MSLIILFIVRKWYIFKQYLTFINVMALWSFSASYMWNKNIVGANPIC